MMGRMWTASDDALLAGMAAGDADAAAAFVRRFQARVYGVAAAVVGDRSLADDIAQEAFLRAWRHAGAYDARRGSVVTWLLTITRNLGIDALRAGRSAPVDPDTFALLTAAGSGPEGAAVAADEARRVRDALAALPAEQRRAVLLARLAGMTAAEIGEHEGIPLGTAKTRIRAAMLHLRDARELT